MFTLGNISALAATCFLVGPKKQLQNMSQRDRWVSALAFTVAMIVTLIASIHVRSFPRPFAFYEVCYLCLCFSLSLRHVESLTYPGSTSCMFSQLCIYFLHLQFQFVWIPMLV